MFKRPAAIGLDGEFDLETTIRRLWESGLTEEKILELLNYQERRVARRIFLSGRFLG
ncbi:MAG: hypothetical protein ACM3YO_08735 [Bacteroidota bacterium]